MFSITLLIALLALFINGAFADMNNSSVEKIDAANLANDTIITAQDAIIHRHLVIDLGDGIKTDAEVTLPVEGNGTHGTLPGILLIHGSGRTDMNEYVGTVKGLNEPTRPFLQIAEYLSPRGFVVLRYNKRGVGLNGTVLNASVVNDTTFEDLIEDAKKALNVLEDQPEVDRSDITILGHSEGTAIAPRIAAEDKGVSKIVLMGAMAQNLKNLLYFQLVTRPLAATEGDLDLDHNGQLSIKEVASKIGGPEESSSSILASELTERNNTTGQYEWNPEISANRSGNISIQGDLRSAFIELFERTATSNSWFKSHLALNDTLDVIGNVPASILILNGDNDAQTPVGGALLLEQRLTAVRHPDHTLITYPGVGHSFYPTEGWSQPLGPVGENVLSDMYSWLTSPDRKVRYLT